MLLFFVLIVLLAFCFSYFKGIKYCRDSNVPFEMPLPFFGNMLKNVLRRECFADTLNKLYTKFSDSRYFAFFNFQSRVVVIKDPELIKMVAVKDFDAFPLHQRFSSDDTDPLWSKNLFAVADPEKWRQMRSTLSPSFTSSKMRFMFKLMNDCASSLADYYLDKKKTVIKVDMKDIFERYSNDVIATTAFGVTCDSLKERNNDFFLMGKDITDFTGIKGLKFLVYSMSPFLAKVLKVMIIGKEPAAFFRRLIKQNIKSREENGIVRPDMIHLLMEARKNLNKQEIDDNVEDAGFAVVKESEIIQKETQVKRELTDDDITAQAVIFFIAGFNTVSTLMVFTALELAANPDIQNKLAEEILQLYKTKRNSPSYEDVLNLTYLDMVISESLRKWPPTLFINRTSFKPYTLKPPSEQANPLYMPKGSLIWVPVCSIHRDEKYYANPEAFDPERFSQGNKANIKPYAYLPFGIGPRNCIGSRFALIETKILFYHLLAHFEVIPMKETHLPVKWDKGEFLPKPQGGSILGLKPRKC